MEQEENYHKEIQHTHFDAAEYQRRAAEAEERERVDTKPPASPERSASKPEKKVNLSREEERKIDALIKNMEGLVGDNAFQGMKDFTSVIKRLNDQEILGAQMLEAAGGDMGKIKAMTKKSAHETIINRMVAGVLFEDINELMVKERTSSEDLEPEERIELMNKKESLSKILGKNEQPIRTQGAINQINKFLENYEKMSEEGQTAEAMLVRLPTEMGLRDTALQIGKQMMLTFKRKEMGMPDQSEEGPSQVNISKLRKAA